MLGLFLFALAAPVVIEPAGPTSVLVRLPLTDGPMVGRVDPAVGETLLRFTLVHEDNTVASPILGRYERTETELRFTPRYALQPGKRYRATAGERSVEYRVPDVKKVPPTVERIEPSAKELPANLLKFYVHFSKPMRESKDIFDRITLTDDQGNTVPDPWRRAELWSADGKRLTLLIHPGRIKQGIGLNTALGPVLEPNRTYTLTLSADLAASDGELLGKPVVKTIRTLPTARERVQPEKWTITEPSAGTREPLILDVPRALDAALFARWIDVTDAQETVIAGKVVLARDETRWIFTPTNAWPETVVVRVDPRLEDIAGNTPLAPFDVDREEPTGDPPTLNRTLKLKGAKR